MKGFIFLYGSEILLRFVKTNAFINLEARHDITYVAVSSSKMMKDGGVDSNFSSILSKVEWIPFYSERHRRWVQLFDLSCIRFMDRSSSFKLRHQEAARLSPKRAARLEKRADPSSYESYRSVLETEMGLNPAILSLTLEKRPDFFVLPSALLDYITDDVLQIADALSIPTLMLVAGWDNLSSKGLIQHHPTVMGVWGEQSRMHAVEIQGVDPKSVHVIGAPHYEDFRIDPTYQSKSWRENLGIRPGQALILFAGSFHAFDETALLQEIDQAISKGELPLFHILYRPHPWRAPRTSEENFLSMKWQHVTMDPDIANTYGSTKQGYGDTTPDNFLFRLNHLLQIYRSVDGVISPMSTVLLEALMFNLPILAVAFGDGKHTRSSDEASRMEHFKEFFDHPALKVCHDRKLFLREVDQFLKKTISSTRIDMGSHVQYFLFRDDKPYSIRIAGLVDTLLDNDMVKPSYERKDIKPGKSYEPGLIQRMVRKITNSD